MRGNTRIQGGTTIKIGEIELIRCDVIVPVEYFGSIQPLAE